MSRLHSALALLLLAFSAACSHAQTQAAPSPRPMHPLRYGVVRDGAAKTYGRSTRPAAVEEHSEKQLVASIVQHTYHTPTRRVAISGNFALVEWAHAAVFGYTVGHAVLQKRHGRWFVLAAGGGPYDARLLTDFGVPLRTARVLVGR